MLSYSIAIRTLGTAGEKFIRELESIKRLTLQPDKVMIYIAEGFTRPDFQIGKEQYVWVKKGMMSQRLLNYYDIDSDIILFLDDDVELAPYSTESMINALEENNLDALGSDIFLNHKMPFLKKIYSALVNGVTPHYNKKWAFKVKKNGAFSYHNNPRKDLYLSQSCAGPVWMIKKSVYEKLSFTDELWLDKFKFAYFDDQLESYKVFKNGYRLGVMFNSGIKNLDAQTSSGELKKGTERIYIRTKASLAIWWRTIYMTESGIKKVVAAIFFMIKISWLFFLFFLYSLTRLSPKPINQYLKGLKDGWILVHTQQFNALHPYVISKT